MSWLKDDKEIVTEEKESIWVKLPDPSVGESTELKMRLMDEEPLGTFTHWHENKPYNCPGMKVCPVCAVRQKAMAVDPESAKEKYRLNYKYVINALVNEDGVDKMKIYSFGGGVGKKLQTFAGKYGDLRDYDVTILKRRTGKKPQNIEYEVLYEGKSELSGEQELMRDQRHDLTEFVAPASFEALASVAKGETPDYTSREDVQTTKDSGINTTEVSSGKATRADIMLFKALAEEKGFELSHFGVEEKNPPSKRVIDSLIADLQNSGE